MMLGLLLIAPPETWVCFLGFAGILMIIGFRKVALGLAGSVLLLALFSPFIDALVDLLPPWILVIMMIFFVISLLRFIFGERVADHLIARLLYDVILMPFRFVGWVFRGPGRRA